MPNYTQGEKRCITEKPFVKLLKLNSSANKTRQYFHTNYIKERLFLTKTETTLIKA